MDEEKVKKLVSDLNTVVGELNKELKETKEEETKEEKEEEKKE